ncbi:MAG: hypothetical protein PUG10_09340 [Lachnospiraceae bacterium]|nr:hypothetical protein [Lachnospiraceae bacterium]
MSEKKLVSFNNFTIVNKIVKDRAIVSNESESSIIENIIIKDLLPENKEGRFIVENVLYGDNGGIKKTLEVIFQNNEAGLNFKSKYDNLLPIVEFAKTQQLYSNSVLTGKEPELHHCISQVKGVIGRLEELSNEKNDINYKEEAKWGKELLHEMETQVQFSRLINFYALLTHSWEDLKNYSITYRLLFDLVKLNDDWNDNAANRIELAELIRTVSRDWN